jgi:hypothetical protein
MKWPQSKLKTTKPRIITSVLHDNSCNWIEQKPKKSTYQNENLNNPQNNYKSMVAMACLMPSSTCSRSLYTKSFALDSMIYSKYWKFNCPNMANMNMGSLWFPQ